jgi:hypothetical protein
MFHFIGHVFGFVVVMVLSLAVIAEGADKKKKPKGTDNKSKTGVFDETSEPTDDEMSADEKKSDSKGAKPAVKEDATKEESDEDEGGFGSGRKTSTAKAKKLDDASLAGDKDKLRYVKSLKKQFVEPNAYYLVQAMEQGMEEDKTGGDPQSGQAGMRPYEKSEMHVLAGQEEAVSFVVEYMSEYGNPWEKKPKKEKGSRGKKEKQAADKAGSEPPKPVRDWKILGYYATSEEAEYVKNERAAHQNNARQPANDDGIRRGREDNQ